MGDLNTGETDFAGDESANLVLVEGLLGVVDIPVHMEVLNSTHNGLDVSNLSLLSVVTTRDDSPDRFDHLLLVITIGYEPQRVEQCIHFFK